jgi:hypothetical protein
MNEGPVYFSLGRMTASITWMTPLVARMSVCTTWALSTITRPLLAAIAIVSPLTAFAYWSFTTSAAITLPLTT